VVQPELIKGGWQQTTKC